jgi:hypothetical protein
MLNKILENTDYSFEEMVVILEFTNNNINLKSKYFDNDNK